VCRQQGLRGSLQSTTRPCKKPQPSEARCVAVYHFVARRRPHPATAHRARAKRLAGRQDSCRRKTVALSRNPSSKGAAAQQCKKNTCTSAPLSSAPLFSVTAAHFFLPPSLVSEAFRPRRRRRVLGLVTEKKRDQPLGAALPPPSSCSCAIPGFGSLASSSNQLVGGPTTQIFVRGLVRCGDSFISSTPQEPSYLSEVHYTWWSQSQWTGVASVCYPSSTLPPCQK